MDVRRVLMTADAVGGVWTYAMQLASLLAARGVEVQLATLGPAPTREQRAEAASIEGLDLRVGAGALEWMPDPWDDVERAGEWLLALDGAFDPDVVHLNGYVHAVLPWRAPVVSVAHSCVCSWWHAVHGGSPPETWRGYRARVEAGLRAADAVVAPSTAMRAAIHAWYGADIDVVVIPNCRERRTAPSAAKEPIVFAAGRIWDPAKNLALLGEAAAGLAWPVYVAGSTAAPGGSAHAVAGLRCLGPLGASEVAGWMARSAIYALPARYEPFGLSVLEAAQAECALVLGDIESLREFWSDVARFVHPRRADELRWVLDDLISHPAERTALARAARERARCLAPERHVSAYTGLYQELMTAHDGTAHSTRPYRRSGTLAGRTPQRGDAQ